MNFIPSETRLLITNPKPHLIEGRERSRLESWRVVAVGEENQGVIPGDELLMDEELYSISVLVYGSLWVVSRRNAQGVIRNGEIYPLGNRLTVENVRLLNPNPTSLEGVDLGISCPPKVGTVVRVGEGDKALAHLPGKRIVFTNVSCELKKGLWLVWADSILGTIAD